MASKPPPRRNVKGRYNPPRKEFDPDSVKMGIAHPMRADITTPIVRAIYLVEEQRKKGYVQKGLSVVKAVNKKNPRGGVGARKKKK